MNNVIGSFLGVKVNRRSRSELYMPREKIIKLWAILFSELVSWRLDGYGDYTPPFIRQPH